MPSGERGYGISAMTSGTLYGVTSRPGSSTDTSKPAGPSPEQVGEGISAFLGRVLDQLSITCWLPAVFFVGNTAVLLVLRGKKRLVLSDAVQDLVALRWGALVVLVFAVIIVAMVIQAFEFENLRYWEGYLRSAAGQRWSALRIGSFQQKLEKLEMAFVKQRLDAFDDARRRALDNNAAKSSERAMWNAMEKVLHGRELDDGEELVADQAAIHLNWPSRGDPSKLHVWDVTRLKLAEFPESHRVLPTRLGNVMRAAEDHVVLGSGEDLEGFMIRHMDELPKTIVAEYAAYRRRLEMYCELMFVLGSLGFISVSCLWGYTSDIGWRIFVPGLYVGAVWVSYKAAIASALGFGQALKEATKWLQKP